MTNVLQRGELGDVLSESTCPRDPSHSMSLTLPIFIKSLRRLPTEPGRLVNCLEPGEAEKRERRGARRKTDIRFEAAEH